MRWILVALSFLIITPSQAFNCYSSIRDARQDYKTEHLYYLPRKEGICWHISKAKQNRRVVKVKRTIEILQIIPVPRSNPLETPSEEVRSQFTLTPEQGNMLLDMLFPEIPVRR